MANENPYETEYRTAFAPNGLRMQLQVRKNLLVQLDRAHATVLFERQRTKHLALIEVPEPWFPLYLIRHQESLPSLYIGLPRPWPSLTVQGRTYMVCLEQHMSQINALRTPEVRQASWDWLAARVGMLSGSQSHELGIASIWWLILNTSSPLLGLYTQPTARFIAYLRSTLYFPPPVPEPVPPVRSSRRQLM